MISPGQSFKDKLIKPKGLEQIIYIVMVIFLFTLAVKSLSLHFFITVKVAIMKSEAHISSKTMNQI